eukprot:gene4293-4545_t
MQAAQIGVDVVIPSAASSQLSQAELAELLAENAKLKQLLNTYADKLSPDQSGSICPPEEMYSSYLVACRQAFNSCGCSFRLQSSLPSPAAVRLPSSTALTSTAFGPDYYDMKQQWNS